MMFFVAVLALASAASAQRCPESYGVQTYEHETYCDAYYKVRCGFIVQSIMKSESILYESL